MALRKLAMVGCGKISRVHLKALQSLKGKPAVVTTLVDSKIEAAQELNTLVETPCQIFQTLQEANKHGDFDAALLMVPHNLHFQYATECLEAGKHVLLEKPVATNVPDCMKLMEHASSTDKVILVAENSVFWPEIVLAKELINKGSIGDVYYIQANYWESIGSKDFNQGYIPEWRFDSKNVGGGVLMDGAIHWIRSMRTLMGDISEVAAVTGHPWKRSQGESLAHALLKFKNNKIGALHCHVNVIPMEEIPFFQIFGTKGEITIHGKFEGGITIRTTDTNAITTEYPGGYICAFGPQLSYFLSMIERGERIRPEDTNSIWEGSRDVSVAHAMYKSVDTQLWESTDFNNFC